jgi:hypothetical protein
MESKMAQCHTLVGSSLNVGISVEQHEKSRRDNPSLRELGITGSDLSGNITMISGPWVFVRFKIGSLAFGSSKLPALDLKPVGFIEGKKPLWRRYYQIVKRQDEIWRLGSDENLILVDSYSAIRILGYGMRSLYEPTPEQVYTYFSKQGLEITDKSSFASIIENQRMLEELHGNS